VNASVAKVSVIFSWRQLMKRLCFGTFAKTLQKALQKPNSNQAVAELLLGLIIVEGGSSEQYTLLPKKVSALFNFTEDVQEDIVSHSTKESVSKSMSEHFKKKVVPCLNSVLIEDLKANLRKLIINDNSISKVTANGLIALLSDDLSHFLSAVYLYAISKSNKMIEGESSLQTLFAQKIDAISDKTKDNKNPFHYLNANLGYYGRDSERGNFVEFLKSDEQILTISVTGYGGSGKSKFVYETITQLQGENSVWKFVYLDKLIICDLMSHPYGDYSYERPLCLIIDYAGRYADGLGMILSHLSNIDSDKLPEKIRVVMIERQGLSVQIDTFGEKLILPDWFMNISRASNGCEILNRNTFLEMSDLSEEDVMSIAKDYRNADGVGIIERLGSDEKFTEEWSKVWEYVNRRGIFTTKVKTIRPLIVLFMIDSAISSSGGFYYDWSIDDILETIIARYTEHWKQNLCGNDMDFLNAVKKLLMYSTACEPWNVGEIIEGLESETTLLNKLGKTRLSEILPYINEYDVYENKILAFEPDLLGEFFVLRVLNDEPNTEERRRLVNLFWKNNANSFAMFMQMCIDDYSYSNYFHDLFDDFENVFNADESVQTEKIADLMDGLLVQLTYVGESGDTKRATRAAAAETSLR
jgi:hypothetical protein